MSIQNIINAILGFLSPSMSADEVTKALNEKKGNQSENLDWQHSIVDLLKLLGLPSSLSDRKAMAKELGYTGSYDDSATMNIWLHAQVMKKIEAHGIKI